MPVHLSVGYADLSGVERAVLCGLLHEHGTAAWAQTHEDRWQRHGRTWAAVDEALGLAAAGQRPAAKRPEPPGWLVTLVRHEIAELGAAWHQLDGFAAVRLLERLGLVALEPDDSYVLALVGGLGDRWGHFSRAGQLRADPVLLERTWRIFEVEGGGQVSLANIDKFSEPAASWQATISELVADGTMDRQRVLRCCLQALQRDFAAYRAGWYSRMYSCLQPTPVEAAQHQAQYRALLRSEVSATVAFAARRLRQVSAAGHLDDDAYEGLRPGLTALGKGAALDIVRVLHDINHRRPDLRLALAVVAAAGMDHPEADVQRATVSLLAALDASEIAHSAARMLAPSIQRQLGHQPDSATPTPRRAPAPARQLAGYTDADVLDRTAGLLEDASDAIEVELVLAALARLGQPAVLEPLAKRAQQILQRGPREGVTEGWLRGQLARLVMAAAARHTSPLPAPTPRTGFLVNRLALAEAVLSGQRPPATLLATPTSADGYLEPGQLLDRLAGQPSRPQTEDLAAALLRLAPDGREQALGAVQGTDEIAMVLRHALGAPGTIRAHRDGPGTMMATAALWAAASRTRAPRDDDPVLLDAGMTKAGQGRPVQSAVTSQLRTWTVEGHQYHCWDYAVCVQHSAEVIDPQQPTLAASGTGGAVRRLGLEDWIGWLVLTNPHDLEPVLTELIFMVLDSDYGASVSYDATRVLSALGHHPGPLGSLGALTLAAGMASGRVEHRVLAVDAITEFAGTGRLNASDLAAAMSQLAHSVQLSRWGLALTSLAQAMPGLFVPDLITALIPALNHEQRGTHALLEVLLEETVRQDLTITQPELRGWLANQTGTGRKARAARELLRPRSGPAGPRSGAELGAARVPKPAQRP